MPTSVLCVGKINDFTDHATNICKKTVCYCLVINSQLFHRHSFRQITAFMHIIVHTVNKPLLADLTTTCGMIWKIWIRSTKPVANDIGHSFFRSGEYKEISDLRTLGWPIQINRTFLEHSEEPYIMHIIKHTVTHLQRSTCTQVGLEGTLITLQHLPSYTTFTKHISPSYTTFTKHIPVIPRSPNTSHPVIPRSPNTSHSGIPRSANTSHPVIPRSPNTSHAVIPRSPNTSHAVIPRSPNTPTLHDTNDIKSSVKSPMQVGGLGCQ